MKKSLNYINYALWILELVVSVLVTSNIRYISKEGMDSIFYLFSALPLFYYIGFATLIVILAYNLIFLKKANAIITISSIILLAFYLEAPRLMYSNGFQMEYFHQAMIYQVYKLNQTASLDYGPLSDFANIFYTIILSKVLGLGLDSLVSYITPISFQIYSLLMIFFLAYSLKRYLLDNKTVFALALFLFSYISLSDVELAFDNHYTFGVTISLIFTYTLTVAFLRNSDKEYLLVTLVFFTLTFSHIYFSTLYAASLLLASIIYIFTRPLKRNRKVFFFIIISLIAFTLWHGFSSSWSIHSFYSEFTYSFIPSVQLLFEGGINPTKPIPWAESRYGIISVKESYLAVLWLKLISAILINAILYAFILYESFSRVIKRGLKVPILNVLNNHKYLIAFSVFLTYTLGLLAYGVTGTAHLSRVLEGFALASLLLFYVIFNSNSSSRNLKKIMLVISISAIILLPTKFLTLWGTSSTYIGFTQKYVEELRYIVNYNSYTREIHFIGSDPSWFLNIILPDMISSDVKYYTISLNEPLLNKTMQISTYNWSLHLSRPHLVVIDLTSGAMPLNAKYDLSKYLNTYMETLYELMIEKADLLYTAGNANYMLVISQ